MVLKVKSPWNGRSLTIVALPTAETSDVLHVMKVWASDRLLGNFLFLTPEQIETIDGQPLKVIASVFGIDDLGEIKELKVDLFQELARNEFDVVRLMAVQVLDGETDEISVFNDSINLLAQYVEKSLPLPSSKDDAFVKKTKLFKINLLVAPTEAHQARYKSAILDNWNLNIVASPEDRSTPWTGDAFVRPDERFPRFVAMYVASIGGLWNGLGSGPFEIMERENSQQGTIWVARAFVNSVLTDGLSRRIAARALQEIGNPDSETFDQVIGVEIPGTVMIPDQDAERWVDWMVKIVFSLDSGALTFKNPLNDIAPQKERWYELQQIKNFLAFCWDKIKAIPWWMWIWIRRLLGRTLTNVFQGSTGKAVVGISQDETIDSRDKLIVDKVKSIGELSNLAKKALATPHLSSTSKSNPELWKGIRSLVFSMLDASNRGQFMSQEDGQRIPVFSRVSQVIEDPQKKWRVDSVLETSLNFNEISWSNLEKLHEVSSAYKSHLDVLRKKKDDLTQQLLDLNSRENGKDQIPNTPVIEEAGSKS